MTSPNVTLDRPETAQIREIARADLVVANTAWAFAQERRGEIDQHFATLKQANPTLWNGRVLLFRNCMFSGDALTGDAFEADYASFCAWHAWRRPDASVKNVFSAAAVEGSDGAFLLGVMGSHTTNAGHVYFPCGTPDPEDVTGSRVDLDLSARRELIEETGLDASTFDVAPGWLVISIGPFLALFKRMRSREPGEALRQRVLSFLSAQKQPELSDVLLVRKLADLSPAMPPFVTAFLEHRLSSRLPG
jgi:8-oxo-dGTP pyrophosphatase MutT (NUDIX family)